MLVLTASLGMTAPGRCGLFDDNTIHRGYIFDDQTIGAGAHWIARRTGPDRARHAFHHVHHRRRRLVLHQSETGALCALLPARITEQHVFAVYFDKSKKVVRTGNYGLEDGSVVDFSSRETVTGGGENRLLQTLLKQTGNFQMKF